MDEKDTYHEGGTTTYGTACLPYHEGGTTTYGTACLPYHRASRRITNSQNSVPEEDNRWLRLR